MEQDKIYEEQEKSALGFENKMVYSSERPLTSRTRKRIQQIEDEELALEIAKEDDDRIARK